MAEEGQSGPTQCAEDSDQDQPEQDSADAVSPALRR